MLLRAAEITKARQQYAQKQRQQQVARGGLDEEEEEEGQAEMEMGAEEVDMTQPPSATLAPPAAAAAASSSAPSKKSRFTPRKVVYIAPLKALCEERYSDWAKFRVDFELKILQVTGDREASIWQLNAAQIIITTPEKWSHTTHTHATQSHATHILSSGSSLIVFTCVQLLFCLRQGCIEVSRIHTHTH